MEVRNDFSHKALIATKPPRLQEERDAPGLVKLQHGQWLQVVAAGLSSVCPLRSFDDENGRIRSIFVSSSKHMNSFYFFLGGGFAASAGGGAGFNHGITAFQSTSARSSIFFFWLASVSLSIWRDSCTLV
jgi:hypothetical protein